MTRVFQLPVSNKVMKQQEAASRHRLSPGPPCGGAGPVAWGGGKDIAAAPRLLGLGGSSLCREPLLCVVCR